MPLQTQVENQKVAIAISVEPHEYFARDGHDLHLNVPLTMYEAVMGTELTVRISSISERLCGLLSSTGTHSQGGKAGENCEGNAAKVAAGAKGDGRAAARP
jgi:DnaJ-class molecular chaperone